MLWLYRYAIVLALVAAASTTSVAQTVAANETPQVRAAGTAKRGLRPDVASFTVQFSATGKSPRDAGRAVAMRADDLRRAFRGGGMPADSLLSGSQWYWWRGRIELVYTGRLVERPGTPPSRPTTYSVTDTTYRASDAIELRVHDLTKVGALIDSALAHGITDITPVRFAATTKPEVLQALTREATVLAQRQAEAMASASGLRLGRLMAIGTQPESRYDPYGSMESSIVATGAGDGGATTVVQPSIPVSVTVYGRWQVVP